MRTAPLVLPVLAAVSLAACGGSETAGDRGDAPPRTTSAATDASPISGSDGGATAEGRLGDTTRNIGITVDGSEFVGRLDDNATARGLAALLPQTVTMSDHDGAEKTGGLSRPLSTEGAPDGHDPRAGDIGYYAPGGDLVLYYDDAAPYFDGIVRIGRFSGDLGALRRAPDVRVRVERQRGGR
ncbi:cyclophilin-like fold protein [Patulibacter sp.]|uniref:cyclophilin-like fold protein n=1 Tax=Patulibacter sp. TaxID=1912859 RepID=UPI00271CF3AF|nr:cyclophilin-like fold protein [Patulibacter sp.]MDO9408661.1 cyclophilin-like fold protein [Patulibacter sp.]